MQRRHIDLVDIGPFLAIDFDIDEQLIHHPRGRFVLKALVRHHVTPMTRGITNREKNGLVALLGLRQRFGSPGPPVDWVVLVLQEVRTRLGGETVSASFGGRLR